ncbi:MULTISPECIES: response regulator transcription factor [unclassified Pseudomonas]|uniref:response regulator transcription factor n=1 Tax=unclassified Pseudomonas TaxID=196821 RepID=UPI000F57002C|nr:MULTISPECIES: response regulator transcription factor [unclassified Pseudomonas]AZF03590.1 putative two-component response regulator [Pseudomonas sp. R5-89-07]AZF46061.1 putative two-component response regulator [Pseudomonas sp. R2-7-07]
MGRIVIVDDHPLIRLAVKVALEEEGHTVLAEVDNGSDALEIARRLLPDLIILDLSIPSKDGFAVIAHLKSIGLAVKILVLTSGEPRNFAMRCLQAGAAGFVSKGDNLDKLAGAVKAVLSGYSYFPEDTIFMLRENAQGAHDEGALIRDLSDREITVLRLLAQGFGNQEIAETLIISHKTVSTYKVRLQRKLNAPNLVALVELAKRNGIS